MNFKTVLFICLSFSSCSKADNPKSSDSELEVFRKLFQEKRFYQLSAVKQLLNLGPEKQIKLLETMISQITKVLTTNKIVLIESGYEIQERTLPEDERLKEALALVLENTCFASDLLLRFPHFMHKKLKEILELDPIYKWSLGKKNPSQTSSLEYLLHHHFIIFQVLPNNTQVTSWIALLSS